MTDLTQLSLAEARDGLKAKQFSAKELTKAHLQKMAVHKSLNAYIVETPDVALQAAERSDLALEQGRGGALEGVPVAVKDLFCTNGVQTTAGSRILKGFIPPYESTVTEKLFASGAVMLGKTNMDEFAMGSANITSHYGPVVNPWRRKGDTNADLTPGGSSGGSAAAVAGRLALGALGSDTGGSIRQPASFCGIVGIKPTYGRCSRYGMVAFASSLDQAGVFTRTVRDSAIMLEAISGHDPKDSTSVNKPVPNFEASVGKSVKGMRIGIPKEYYLDGMPEEIKALWEQGMQWLRDAGAEVIEISLPRTECALPAYYIIAPAEASSNLARYDGVRFGHRVMPEKGGVNELYELSRGEGFGLEVKRRILIGTYVLSHGYYDAYYKKAQRIRTLITQDFNDAFQKVDAILTPTAPSAAFGIHEKMEDPLQMYLNDIFTVSVNLAWLPGISIPAGLDKNGLPLGLQIIGKAFDEETCFTVGAVLEQAAGFTAKPEGF